MKKDCRHAFRRSCSRLSLAACGASSTAPAGENAAAPQNGATAATADENAADGVRIAIVQQMDHASLDQIRAAIEAELDAQAAAQASRLEYELFNGQNDATTLNQIGTQVIADGYDAIIPIATLAAQCMANAAAETETPVVYAAISDPAAADLTGISYVTGTSDYLDTEFIMQMMFAATPDLETVGLLYSNSEPNSEAPSKRRKPIWTARASPMSKPPATPTTRSSRPPSTLVRPADAASSPPPTTSSWPPRARGLGHFCRSGHPLLYRCGQLCDLRRAGHLRRQL